MTKQEIKGDWTITKARLKQKWAHFTGNYLQYAEAKRDEVIGRIQKRAGETREAGVRAAKESRSLRLLNTPFWRSQTHTPDAARPERP